MRELTQAEITAWIDAAETASRKLKEAIADEEIYVAARVATSSIPYSHLTKAFQIHEAILVLCRIGFATEAIALSRSILEMYITLRWIINQDQSKRAEEFALFVAKRKEYVANTLAKYRPGSPVAVDAVRFVQNTYKQYVDKYDSWVFWSNKPINLRQLAEEKEVLIPDLVSPNDDAVMFYELFYSTASDYVHVTALALDEVYPVIGARYTATGAKSPRNVFNAIIYATHWLFYIMTWVNAYQQMGLHTKIETIVKEFSNLHTTL